MVSLLAVTVTVLNSLAVQLRPEREAVDGHVRLARQGQRRLDLAGHLVLGVRVGHPVADHEQHDDHEQRDHRRTDGAPACPPAAPGGAPARADPGSAALRGLRTPLLSPLGQRPGGIGAHGRACRGSSPPGSHVLPMRIHTDHLPTLRSDWTVPDAPVSSVSPRPEAKTRLSALKHCSADSRLAPVASTLLEDMPPEHSDWPGQQPPLGSRARPDWPRRRRRPPRPAPPARRPSVVRTRQLGAHAARPAPSTASDATPRPTSWWTDSRVSWKHGVLRLDGEHLGSRGCRQHQRDLRRGRSASTGSRSPVDCVLRTRGNPDDGPVLRCECPSLPRSAPRAPPGVAGPCSTPPVPSAPPSPASPSPLRQPAPPPTCPPASLIRPPPAPNWRTPSPGAAAAGSARHPP